LDEYEHKEKPAEDVELGSLNMGRRKTVVEVPIEDTQCWNCSLLDHVRFKDSNGNVAERFRCPKNARLPKMLLPCFAEKCSLFKPKELPSLGE
jgi:hypothetical protein